MQSRRSVLLAGAGATLAAALPRSAEADLRAEPLRRIAASRGLLFGAAAVWWHCLAEDKAMAAIYAREAGVIVPDYEMKWASVRPSPGTYVYDAPDRIAEFCAAHDIRLRGHNLAWEESNPAWMNSVITKANAESYLIDHIRRLVGRYAGKVQSWDVVNEPIWPDHGKPGGLRDGIWLKTLGERYIDIAFHAAHAADPKALLVVNEAGTEGNTPLSHKRRECLLALIDRLKRDGVPVQAVGLECHFSTRPRWDPADFAQYLGELSRRGLKILISELDVNDAAEPSEIAARDAAVASVYHELLSTALRNPSVIAVLTWELSDKYSWLRDPHLGKSYRRADNALLRPLPFDDAMHKKPCYDAVARALAEAPMR
jgi:endo-1,4-beta-xylanase